MTTRKQNQVRTDTQKDSETFAECAHQAIAKHYKKITKHEPDVVADKDPEALHQMRVGIRRLRSTLQVFANVLDLPEAGSEKNIGRIGRDLGKVRDIDVLQDDLANIYAPALPEAEQQSLKKVFKYLAKKRKRALKKMRSLLTGALYQNFVFAYDNWLTQPTYQTTSGDSDVNFADLAAEFVIPDLLIPLLSQLFMHPGWLVGTKLVDGSLEISAIAPEELESQLKIHDEALHDLRKQIKRVRYQTEFFTDFYGEDYANEIKHFQDAQEALGKLQDSFVLEMLLAKALGKNVETKMPIFSEQLRQQRVKAWQELRPIQALYIDRQFRDRLIELMLKPITAQSIKEAEVAAESTTTKTREATRTTKATGSRTRSTSKAGSGQSKTTSSTAAKSTRSSRSTTQSPNKTAQSTKSTNAKKTAKATVPTTATKTPVTPETNSKTSNADAEIKPDSTAIDPANSPDASTSLDGKAKAAKVNNNSAKQVNPAADPEDVSMNGKRSPK
jgi:CHAD domain-containing protein